MSFYQNAQSTVLDLLTQFGLPVIIKRETGEVFDPVTGTETPGTVTEYPATGIVADFGLENVDETLIQKGDKKITLAAKGLAVVPQLSDRVVANGIEYTIQHIKEVNPAGTPLIYELQGRQ